MDKKKIENILDEEIKDMPWTYRYWEREDTFEIRNTGERLTDEEVDELFDDFLEKLEIDGFQVLLEGKAGVLLEEENLWLCYISKDGGPGEKDKKIKPDELKKLFLKSLHRVDFGPLPSNRITVESSKIIDIYTEKVGDDKFLHITFKNGFFLTLRNDGGLQIRT